MCDNSLVFFYIKQSFPVFYVHYKNDFLDYINIFLPRAVIVPPWIRAFFDLIKLGLISLCSVVTTYVHHVHVEYGVVSCSRLKRVRGAYYNMYASNGACVMPVIIVRRVVPTDFVSCVHYYDGPRDRYGNVREVFDYAAS